jgi:hypothetical protein
MFLAIYERTFSLSSVSEQPFSFSMHLSVFPFTALFVSTRICVYSLSLSLSIYKVSLINMIFRCNHSSLVITIVVNPPTFNYLNLLIFLKYYSLAMSSEGISKRCLSIINEILVFNQYILFRSVSTKFSRLRTPLK